MKKSVLALTCLAGLEALLGCGYTTFPQYSGAYELQSVSYSDPAFAGKKQIASSLSVVDRMQYYGHFWNHHLQFDFMPLSDQEAGGTFNLQLDGVTRIDDGAWPNDWYNGVEIHHEPKVYGTGAFCNYQYLYFLFLQSTPDAGILQNTYPGHGDCIGKDPTTNMPLCTSLAHPQEVDFDDTGWYNAVDENGGITITLTFSRYLRGDTSGNNNGSMNCILTPDPEHRGEASAVFVYHAGKEDLEDKTDIRKEPLQKNSLNQKTLSLGFFKEIISNIK
ncbi:MAG: hypothetical protein AABX31_02960 [Nanoarchaeota archaeon]